MNTQLMIAGYCPVGNYSFEIIYKKYHTFFVHYAEKTMGEELYAEDVVQDVFINLLQQTNYFVSEGAVLKYIYKALYNRCIDFIRHKQIEQHYEEVSGNDFISALNRDGHNTLLTKGGRPKSLPCMRGIRLLPFISAYIVRRLFPMRRTISYRMLTCKNIPYLLWTRLP